MTDDSLIEAPKVAARSSAVVDLPPALATPPGAGAVCDDQGARKIGRGAAEGLFTGGRVMVAHASLTARRLGLSPPPLGQGPSSFRRVTLPYPALQGASSLPVGLKRGAQSVLADFLLIKAPYFSPFSRQFLFCS